MKINLTKKEIDILADCVDVERNEVFQWTTGADTYGNPIPSEYIKSNIERYEILNNIMKKLGYV